MERKAFSFTIPRKRWLRGKGSGESALLCETGKQCCVGIYLSKLGISDEKLLDMSAGEDLDRLPKQAQWLVERVGPGRGLNSKLANELYWVNDEPKLRGRETKIKKLFAKVGIRVRFTG